MSQIIIVGAGGQGILFTSKIIGTIAGEKGFNVIGSETHGMSQRGGSVVSHIKMGDYSSPLIKKGEADLLIGLEETEALKSLHYLRKSGKCIVNASEREKPEKLKWPPEVVSELKTVGIELLAIPCDKAALSIGSPKVANLVMLGALSVLDFSPFRTEELENCIKRITPEKWIEMNLKAVEAGKKIFG